MLNKGDLVLLGKTAHRFTGKIYSEDRAHEFASIPDGRISNFSFVATLLSRINYLEMELKKAKDVPGIVLIRSRISNVRVFNEMDIYPELNDGQVIEHYMFDNGIWKHADE